jgi:hypothetical protein
MTYDLPHSYKIKRAKGAKSAFEMTTGNGSVRRITLHTNRLDVYT